MTKVFYSIRRWAGIRLYSYLTLRPADPDIRPVYVQMAEANNMNPERPFDMAVSNYYHAGNDLLWKKHMGGQEKPANWKMYYYPWYFKKQDRTRKRKAS